MATPTQQRQPETTNEAYNALEQYATSCADPVTVVIVAKPGYGKSSMLFNLSNGAGNGVTVDAAGVPHFDDPNRAQEKGTESSRQQAPAKNFTQTTSFWTVKIVETPPDANGELSNKGVFVCDMQGLSEEQATLVAEVMAGNTPTPFTPPGQAKPVWQFQPNSKGPPRTGMLVMMNAKDLPDMIPMLARICEAVHVLPQMRIGVCVNRVDEWSAYHRAANVSDAAAFLQKATTDPAVKRLLTPQVHNNDWFKLVKEVQDRLRAEIVDQTILQFLTIDFYPVFSGFSDVDATTAPEIKALAEYSCMMALLAFVTRPWPVKRFDKTVNDNFANQIDTLFHKILCRKE